MDSFKKPFLYGITAAVFLAITLQLDPMLAKNIPQVSLLVSASRFFSFVGDGAFLAFVCAALYFYGRYSNNGVCKEAGKAGFLSVAIAGTLVNLLKASFERPRIEHASNAVSTLLDNTAIFDLTGKYNSFPSGHTTISFALAFVLSKKFPSFKMLFYTVAALVAASRVYLGSHYPSDVYGGALVGLAVGYLVSGDIKSKQRWIIAGLISLTIFLSFFKIGSFLLFDVDEAVFSEASREMVETGDYITPTYNYEPRYDKPILFYWFMSSAFKLFGVNEFAARFTSAGFGTLLVLMTFLFVKRIKGFNPAVFASFALLLNIEFFVYTHSAVTDMTLAFFITGSIYAFYLGITEENKRWLMLSWASSAMAVLTKGVIGLLFPAVIAFLYLLASGNIRKLKEILKPSYILVFLLVAGPWYAAEFYVNGWEFFDAFIVKHHIQRYSDANSSHGGPFFYYILVLLIGFFPWVSMLPGALYKSFKDRKNSADGLSLLAGIWFIFVLVFFSISRTKLPNYIFPLFPAASILAGLYLHDITFGEGRPGRKSLFLLTVISVILGGALIALPFMDLRMDIPMPDGFFINFGFLFLIIGALSIVALSRPLSSFVGISALMAIMIIFLRVAGLPPVNSFLQKNIYVFSSYARSIGKDGVLATYEINRPSIPFYAGRGFVKIEKKDTCGIKEYAKKGDFLLITTVSKKDEIKEYGLKEIDRWGEYVLLGNKAPLLPPAR